MRLLAVLAFALAAQDFSPAPRPAAQQYVSYAAEPQTVPAGRLEMVPLHFEVRAGFHINSHRPKDELLMATRLDLDAATGVKLAEMQYPAGQTLMIPVDPPEVLDVYQGAFTVKLPVTATKGDHELTGTLHYQACDRTMCYPPRALPVRVELEAR